MKVAVILPSRGLIFSETAEEVLANVDGVPHKFFFSHDRPIPDCFERPTQRALADESITHLWYVEDDMVLPELTLRNMLILDEPVSTIDYPVSGRGQGAVFTDSLGVVIFCGTGCMLVKREVFDNIRAPYFRSDIAWTVLNYGKSLKFTATERGSNLSSYGLHDVNFGIKLYNAGIPITVLPGKPGQRKLIELGKAGTNNGAHSITTWRKITKNYQLKQFRKLPLAPGTGSKLVTIKTPLGTFNAHQDHAKKLVKQGLAEYIPDRGIIFDDSDVDFN